MKPAVRPSDLQMLEQWLSHELQTNVAQPVAVQVRCALKQETLLVLAEHAPDIAPDIEQFFDRLEYIFHSLDPEQVRGRSPTLEPLPIRLYLRVAGQKQPYTSRSFTLEPAIAPASVEPWLEPAIVEPTETDDAPKDAPEYDALAKSLVHEEPEPEEQVIDEGESAIAPVKPSIRVKPPVQIRSTVSEPAKSKAFNNLVFWLADVPFFNRIPLSALVFSAVAGCLVLGGGLYVLTRPCVVGECIPLKEAQRMSQKSAELAQPTATAQDVVQAYEELAEANYLLGTIPPWSPQYETAQTLLKDYETRAEVFGDVVSALQSAQTAAEKSQSPPHPLATWREVQQTWQQAIALLQEIPTDSPIYLLSQQKLQEYQTNLSAINQRILTEQQAQEQVTAARTAAGIAETRETAAKSSEGWRSVQATWQAVVTALEKVPRGTMAYAEAEQLLAIYQPRWATARDRYAQEQVSADSYNQALVLAEQARRSEQRRQWSQAVDQWRDALSNAEQIPAGTSYHDQMQPLLSSYQTALTTAQENLRTAVVVQDAESRLTRACMATTTICSYSIGANAIQVRLTSDYDWAVQAVINNTQLAGDTNTQKAMQDYVNSLLGIFAEASQKAQMPLDLYNSQGDVFSTYDPQVRGFMRR